MSACTRILGLEGTPEGVEDNGNLTRVAAFPIGIDPEQFCQALLKEDVRANITGERPKLLRTVALGATEPLCISDAATCCVVLHGPVLWFPAKSGDALVRSTGCPPADRILCVHRHFLGSVRFS